MKTFQRIFALLTGILLMAACSNDEGLQPQLSEGVEVRLLAGDAALQSRAALQAGKPVKVWVFQRTDAAVADFTAVPYKTATGHTTNTVEEGGLTAITLDGGESLGGRMTVDPGYTYDFVLMVNQSPAATYTQPDGTEKPHFGTLTGGNLTGFKHGQDLLAARTTVTVPKADQNQEIKVAFTGSTDPEPDAGLPDTKGNLPHLGSAVQVKASLTKAVFEAMGKESISLGVAGMDFNHCLPSSANLPFSATSPAMQYAVQVGGYNSSYALTTEAAREEVITTAECESLYALSGNGYLLPCPKNTSVDISSAVGETVENEDEKNLMHLTFRLTLDGGGVDLTANNVVVPVFKPGYRYTFAITFGEDMNGNESEEGISLKLEVTPWNGISWYTTEGGYGGGEGQDPADKVVITIGGWSNVTYETVEGGYGDAKDDLLKVKVGDFTTVSWSTTEGSY